MKEKHRLILKDVFVSEQTVRIYRKFLKWTDHPQIDCLLKKGNVPTVLREFLPSYSGPASTSEALEPVFALLLHRPLSLSLISYFSLMSLIVCSL